MEEIGFDSEKFIKLQRQAILQRLAKFDGKLYLELGGKIFDDLHASRVLPGYRPDNKIKVLESLKDELEVIFCISARDIEKNKIRADFGITYDKEVLRLIDNLKNIGLKVNSVCITLFNGQQGAKKFANILKSRGEKVYFHSEIEGYPNDIKTVVSDEGYGKNPYIKTTRPIVVVSAPGPGSCKMATALGQMYHESKMGLKSGYAKFETFPVWDLDLSHPVNIAYEASTADLLDENMIDIFHKDAYGIKAVNYNRDLETFPILKAILDSILGSSIYKSPTDMGINVISRCIVNDDICRAAGGQEIIRRYLKAKEDFKKGNTEKSTVIRCEECLKKVKLKPTDRDVCKEARQKAEEKDTQIVTIKLKSGKIVYGKKQGVITASAGAVLNALKELANIPHENILDRETVKNISTLKHELDLGSGLDVKDIFMALCILNTDECKMALSKLKEISGCEVHSTAILNSSDEDYFRKLKINFTCDDVFDE